MKELNKRIAIDIVGSPATVISFTIGVSLLMLAVVIGKGWGLLGFGFCLFSVGVAITNFLFNFDNISRRAIESIEKEKKLARDVSLDQLDHELSSNNEPRDQIALRNMRAIYDEFLDDVKCGHVSAVGTVAMFEQIDKLFNCCEQQLRQQHQIWVMTRKIKGDIRDKLIKQRNSILDEVENSIKNMADVIEEVRSLGLKASKIELSDLSKRLTRQLEIAKATDEALSGIDSDETFAKYAEYHK